MENGDVGFVGLAASLVLVVVALAFSLRLKLRLERELVVSVTRGLVQLLIVGAALAIVIDPKTSLVWSWLWVVGIVVFAAATIKRRAPAVPRLFWIGLAANGATAAIGFAVAFGLRIFPVEGRTLVPIAGMLIGNSMKSGIVAAERIVEALSEQRAEVEARLALGQPWTAASRPVVRSVLRSALSPQIENTKALGIVFLPGAMTGLILAGVEPVDAVLVQLALMYLILGGVVTTTVVTALGAVRRLFTDDHRLVALPRSRRDTG
ncbi:MAG: UDP-glucose/iron transport system permease protein [Solirubrobacteraceae bacterium]|jgi:putative ABC transport system permease protein|nr:UDP-glucose/iron transport system permease protein [Solirubrobacteraceae bacterium]